MANASIFGDYYISISMLVPIVISGPMAKICVRMMTNQNFPQKAKHFNANLVTNWVAKFQNCLYDNDHDYDHMSSACMDHALSPMRRMGCFADTDLAIPSL